MINIPEYLVDKYNVPVPRYTSYPPANFFSAGFSENDYRNAVALSNGDDPKNISLYIHIPFCPKLCHYCGCNTHITRNEMLKTRYLEALKAEIRMLRPLLHQSRKVSQVHWGGGTPNSLKAGQISEIMELIFEKFDFIDQPEIAIECNPAHLDHRYIESLLNMNFNRISLGVQDFSIKVLTTVNREIPVIPVSELAHQIQSSGKAKVNLDFIYGLPYQTVASFSETIEKALEIAPDRLVTFSYAHIPNIKKSQAILEKTGLVPPGEKLKIFENTYRMMKESGYTPIGMDHFARVDDELSLALSNRTIHRNFQGYCTRETTGQVYAFGSTGISQLESAYAQNAKNVGGYIDVIGKGRFTTEKGHVMTNQQKIIRHVITELMCNQYVSWQSAATRFNITPEDLFRNIRIDEIQWKDFQNDGLLEYNTNEIMVTERGRFFIRNIAASFDPAVGELGKTFSKAL